MILKVYTRRHGHHDAYQVARTSNGWTISHLSYQGDCNKRGEPVLFNSLHNDSVNYPSGLGDYLEFLWEEDEAGRVRDTQAALNLISDWLTVCEKASPRGIFSAFS